MSTLCGANDRYPRAVRVVSGIRLRAVVGAFAVCKLIGALTMVGCLVGMVIVPQSSLLDDAKVTLCGRRRLHLLCGCSVRGARRCASASGVRRRVGQLGVG